MRKDLSDLKEYLIALGGVFLFSLVIGGIITVGYFIYYKINRLSIEEETCREYGMALVMDGKISGYECETYIGDDEEMHYRILGYDLEENDFSKKYYYPNKKY